MKTAMTLALLQLFSVSLFGQDRALGERNGIDWKQLRMNAEVRFSKVDWSNKSEWIDGEEKTQKLYYVLGIYELAANLRSDNYMRYEDEKRKEHFYNVGHPFPYTFGVTVGQMMDGLDALYRDYRNTNIRLLDAMHLVQMEVTGKSTADIEWQTRYYRADLETRRQMNEEKYRAQAK